MSYFDCGKRLQVELLVQTAQRLEKFDIPFGRESRMQTSYHMDLGDSLITGTKGGGLNFRYCHLKGMRVAFACAKRAKLTGEHADIGVVDIAVENIGRAIAVFPFTNDISDLAESIQIIRAKESDGFLLADTFALEDLMINALQSWGDQSRACEIFHKATFTHNQTPGKQTPPFAAAGRHSYLISRFI